MRRWSIGIALWAGALTVAFLIDAWFYDTASRAVAEATGYRAWRFGLTETGRASLLSEALQLFKRMGHGLFALLISITMVALGRDRLRQAGVFWLCFIAAGGVGELARRSCAKVRPAAELEAAEVAKLGEDAVIRVVRDDKPTCFNRGHAVFRTPFSPARPLGLPSGHAVVAFAMFAALARFYPRGHTWFLILACGAALSRTLMGAHFLSDVIAGAGVGYATARGILAVTLRE